MSVTETQDALHDELSEEVQEVFSVRQIETIQDHELFQDLSLAQAALRRLAHTAQLGNFSAPFSNLQHHHTYDKHDLRDFGVTEELIQNHLITHHCDHAALWELVARKDELIASDTPVFANKPDDDIETWSKIESTRNNAPVPDFVRTTITNNA